MHPAPPATRRHFLIQGGLGTLGLMLGCTPTEGGKDPLDTGHTGGETGLPDETGLETGLETGAETGLETGETAEIDPWGDLPTTCEEITPDRGTGPFYRTGMPERAQINLLAESGTPMRLYFRVLDQRCAPVAGALVEIWHCAPEAAYDMASDNYRFYGKQYTDAEGRGMVESIVPPFYFDDAGEHAPHVHFQITAEGFAVVATQVQFSDTHDGSGLYPVMELVADPEGFGADSLDIILGPPGEGTPPG